MSECKIREGYLIAARKRLLCRHESIFFQRGEMRDKKEWDEEKN